MKKLLCAMLLGTAILLPTTVKGEELEIFKCTATAYAPTGNLTYTETVPRFGVVAGKKEWLNSSMIIWFDDGDGLIKPQNFYGVFSCEDVGGSQAIKDGRVIDVFIPDYNEAVNFGSKKVIIQIVKGRG